MQEVSKLARLLVLAVAGTLTICSAADREVLYQGPLDSLKTFDNGYLGLYHQKGFSLYGPDGLPRYEAVVDVPSGGSAFVANVAVHHDGLSVAAVDYQIPIDEEHSRTVGGLAWFDAQGKQVRFVPTGNYIPSQVAYAPDGSIYTIGYLGNQDWAEHADYSVLRKYSRDGQELLEAVPRASINPSPEDSHPEPVRNVIGLWGLRVADDRVGFWIFRGDLQRMEWMETDLDGKQIGRWKLDKERGSFAFTSSGTLYADGNGHGVSRFNRATATWESVAGMPEGRLLGADGNSLVFLKRGSNLVRWVQPGDQRLAVR